MADAWTSCARSHRPTNWSLSELKAAQPDDRFAGQIQQYLDDLARHAERHGYDSAHLIVISGQPNKSVRHRVERYAQTRGLTVEFLLYRVQTKLLPHP